ncbi:MAG: flagellar hook-associated protein FlgK [Candidatus Hydrogenedentes bacterium]|nr:flagellar hook-associated protein FlgK [Candidatus Hydrogenedentota bacterium]
MGSLFSALDIARSGLSAAQYQLNVTGNNIANVNTPGYSRQRALLEERFPSLTPFGPLGRGVGIAGIERIRDEFLDEAFSRQVQGLGSSEVQAQYYNLIEDVFLEPSENGFGTRLDRFFDALNDFSNNVESLPVREALLSEGQAMAGSLNGLIQRFDQLRTNANEEVRNLVPEINSIADRIAVLNREIRLSEGGGSNASQLRDQRGVLVDELSRLVEINVRTDGAGQTIIQIGSATLVDASGARDIIAFRNPALDTERNDLVELRFADDNSLVDVTGGEVYGALQIRDTVIPELDAEIDTIAAALIQQLNAIHNQGNGTINLSGTLSSSNAVNGAGTALVSAGLPFPITPGTFDLVVYDSAGVPTTTTINITAATTLNDLATALNGVGNFSASVSGDTINFGANAGFTFSFANDSSGALTALGVNGFFTGRDARSIAVNEDLQDNPGWITSSFSDDILNTGDNGAALQMAALRSALVLDSGAATISDYYQSTVAGLGVDARAINDIVQVEQQFVQNLDERRQEVSGVNLDEEVTSLMLFQRAYEASARLMTVADRMLETLLGIAQ